MCLPGGQPSEGLGEHLGRHCLRFGQEAAADRFGKGTAAGDRRSAAKSRKGAFGDPAAFEAELQDHVVAPAWSPGNANRVGRLKVADVAGVVEVIQYSLTIHGPARGWQEVAAQGGGGQQAT